NLSNGLFQQLVAIQRLGNQAAHNQALIKTEEAVSALRCLFNFMAWLCKYYSHHQVPIPSFDKELIPDGKQQERSLEQLETLRQQLETSDQQRQEEVAKLAASESEIEALHQQVAELKAANQQYVDPLTYNEDETRELIIDLNLREAGWNPYSYNAREFEVTGMPNQSGIGYVDYVLWDDNGLPLAVIEAKKTSVDAETGKIQAQVYADCLEQMYQQRPIIYYTNGFVTNLWDDDFYPPRQVSGFHHQEALSRMIWRRGQRQEIENFQANEQIVDRYYQQLGLKQVMGNFHQRRRKSLVVMATGTGKTRLSIAIVEGLMKSNWVNRVLFLADRNALLTQAEGAFKDHYPAASTARLGHGQQADNARIVFSTYPAMMNAIDDLDQNGVRKLGVGDFDLIIIDEAHRSVFRKFQHIFNYFDAMLLGLTATPRSEVHRNTYRIFELQNGQPTYAYELDTAVNDGYLTPPKGISVPLKFQREGIRYDELSSQEQEEYEDKFYDLEADQMPDQIGAGAINQWLFNQDTVDKVLQHLMEHGLKVKGGDQLGKTIIFAKNQKHAEFIVKRFDANYPHYAGSFCLQIDHSVKQAESLIGKFKIKDQFPAIAVSVDMMDAGIDVPEIVNLVFFKLMRSRTKYQQMMGRGTRLCSDLFGPKEDKQFFFVFDYCQNLEYFQQQLGKDNFSPPEPLKQRIFKRRLALAHRLRQSETDDQYQQLATELTDDLHQTVNGLRRENFIVKTKIEQVVKYSQREAWDQLTDHQLGEIRDHLSGLPTELEEHEAARRFDLLILELQTATLDQSDKQQQLTQMVITIASKLEQKQTVPVVAQQLDLILELQTDQFWHQVTILRLESVRKVIRNLVQFIDDKQSQELVYTDFEDQIGEGVEVGDLVQADPSLRNYRQRMERFLRQHLNHAVVRKIHFNQPIFSEDIPALESVLFGQEGMGIKKDVEDNYGDGQPLALMIREIVGLEPSAAKSVFADFINQYQLDQKQIQFLNKVIDHLTHNGVVEIQELFQQPFTFFHQSGVVGLFPNQAEEIRDLLNSVKRNVERSA
ncbi:MAG: DEAD/DEAH box helicase family protein, partial [Candidatus Poribacteria bacterium]|nr:DEAD/DEAH box helicase family protein [Candidatus Poribacteria bacterium]